MQLSSIRQIPTGVFNQSVPAFLAGAQIVVRVARISELVAGLASHDVVDAGVTGSRVFPEEGQRCASSSGRVGEFLLLQFPPTHSDSSGGFLTVFPGGVQTSAEVPSAEGGGRAAGRGVQSSLHAAGVRQVKRLLTCCTETFAAFGTVFDK